MKSAEILKDFRRIRGFQGFYRISMISGFFKRFHTDSDLVYIIFQECPLEYTLKFFASLPILRFSTRILGYYRTAKFDITKSRCVCARTRNDLFRLVLYLCLWFYMVMIWKMKYSIIQSEIFIWDFISLKCENKNIEKKLIKTPFLQ